MSSGSFRNGQRIGITFSGVKRVAQGWACDGEKRREPKKLTATYLCAVRPSQAWSIISSVRLLGKGRNQELQTDLVERLDLSSPLKHSFSTEFLFRTWHFSRCRGYKDEYNTFPP